jgi:hypothetical protein
MRFVHTVDASMQVSVLANRSRVTLFAGDPTDDSEDIEIEGERAHIRQMLRDWLELLDSKLMEPK